MASCAATRVVVNTSCRVRNRTVSTTTTTTTSASPSASPTAPMRTPLSIPLGNASLNIPSLPNASIRHHTLKAKPSLGFNNNQPFRNFSSKTPLSTSAYRSSATEKDVPKILVASAAAVLAAASSWNFVTPVAATDAAAATAPSTTIGRTVGGGGGGGGPTLKTVYPGVLAEKRAEDDVRQWDDDTNNNPYEVSESAVQGARWTMEDAYTVENGGHFTAVYDGHGGAHVSGMLKDRVHALYKEALPKRHIEESQKMGKSMSYTPSIQSHIASIRSALNRVEREVLKNDDLEYQGSTAVVVIVHQDDEGERTLVAANIGDSRAILCRAGKAVDLTTDHKPCDEREKARIRSMGADIQWDPYGQLYRVNDLSLSRAVGDRFAKPVVSAEAEIDCHPLVDDKDEFFVLASDGLWDVMTSQEVCDYVHHTLNDPTGVQTSQGKIILSPEVRKKKMARIIANEALERGSADNVCVILVWLQKEK